ncbi:DMT family transporter [uncultured Corynebacterium sp.]|uniref:DMT family transporter n=1 Tax=uncultured Corynebacterium sp. TaxID=159447 RepID=UPI0025E030F4|nr:DMT family transporter [uncultured Corynebacterium sp.]
MHNDLLAILLGLGSALTIAWGTVIRHRLADELPDGDGTMQGVWHVIARPMWWAGVFLAMTGYGLQIAALAFGSLLLVQPLLVMSLMFTLPLAAKIDGRRISKSETTWAIVLTIAVAVLVILGRPLPGDPQPPLSRWVPALIVGAVGFIAMYHAARTLLRSEKALVLGLATGWLYGFVAVLSKAVVDTWVNGDVMGLLRSWELWSLIALALIGVAVQQASFNAGALRNSLPAMTCAEPVVAFVLGYAVLGEKFQAQGAQWLWMAAALAAMIVSTVVLSRKSV